MITKDRIKSIAQEVGFHASGITQIKPIPQAESALREWTEQGKHGEMKYLENFEKRKNDFWNRFPNAKSIVVLGVNYYSANACHSAPTSNKRLKRVRAAQNEESKMSFPHVLGGNPKFGFPTHFRRGTSSSSPNTFGDERHIIVDNVKVATIGAGALAPALGASAKTFGDDRGVTGRVARYAWGRDYHKLISEKIEVFKAKLRHETSDEIYFESAVDTKPLLERTLGQQAGLGFIGKQTQLLSLQFGPWLFLSELITNLELEPDQPYSGSCGTCRLCIDECPTEAIEESGRIDARKCIAYLTIEHKTEIPEEFRSKIDDRIFGCDECLNVCPYAAKQKETTWRELTSEKGFGPKLNLLELFNSKSNRQHERQFQDAAISRANRKQLLRNAAIVLGNKADKSVLPDLRRAMSEVPSMVKNHIQWAIQEIENRNQD